MDLFNKEDNNTAIDSSKTPLAERMRPGSLNEFVGQNHLAGKDGVLRKQLKNGTIGSMIFWGPPGCGKTTLARILARDSDADFHQVSAVTSGVKDVKSIIEL